MRAQYSRPFAGAGFFFWRRFFGGGGTWRVARHMEGCPADDELLWWTIFTGCLGLILFLVFQVCTLTRMKRALPCRLPSSFFFVDCVINT